MEKKTTALENLKTQLIKFINNSKNFLRKCKKPSKDETKKLIKVHLTCMLFLGFFGYFVKLIHLPIKNIIAGDP